MAETPENTEEMSDEAPAADEVLAEDGESHGKVLTDEEKNALVEGVESGEIEVQSTKGRTYAAVAPFQIPARAHIVKNGYPRLKLLNEQVAERVARDVEQLLQNEVAVIATDLSVKSFGRACERLPDSVAAIVFAAAPLEGSGLITLEDSMVRMLVDAFFGGDGVKSELYPTNTFTTGELNISNLFATIVLSAMKESWAPLLEIAAERVTTEVSIELVDFVPESDPVICTEYEIQLLNRECHFQVLLPIEMLQPLLPVFDGQKGERNPADEARWARSIERRVVESRVNVTSNVCLPEMTVGDLVELAPGDIIDIEQPNQAVIQAENVSLINGRLGVHRGHNAVEAVEWIDPLQAELTVMST